MSKQNRFMSTEGRFKKLLIAAAVLILLLIGAVGYLWVNKSEVEGQLAQQKLEYNESQRLRDELQEEYDNAIAELDEALAENQDMKEDINKQKAELERQRRKISRMIASGKTSKKALSDAQLEIQQLRSQQQAFLTKIDELEKTNSLLSNEIVQVKSEKKLVEEEVVKVRKQKAEVTAQKNAEIATITKAKQELDAQKAELEKQKVVLEDKVDIGSVVKVDDIAVSAFKLRSNGKLKKKRWAKNVDVIKVCFNTEQNLVTKAGEEEFVLRVLTPIGETMYIENLGSGKFISKANKQEIRYTKAATVKYTNTASEQCINWQPNTKFSKGEYKVEIYNKGYLAGTGSFSLK